MNKFNILIICHNQWGYHVDTYKYADFLSREHHVTYIGWDYGYEKVKQKNVNVQYISRDFTVMKRNINFIDKVSEQISKSNFDLCFIKYFRGCSYLKMKHRRLDFVFDIRSGHVGESKLTRFLYDNTMKIESVFFKNITVISKSLAKKLKLENKAKILPLGSEILSKSSKSFSDLNLLYVGTLTGRDIVKTIDGVALFIKEHKNEVNVKYSIVGDGLDFDKIQNRIHQLGISEYVKLLGRIPFSELGSVMDNYNIGVSFVPITSFYDCQPVTKTFDYLLSGMPVLATATSENKMVINNKNGVCILDTPSSFKDGLNLLWNNKGDFNSNKIRNDALIYSWDDILESLMNYITELVNKGNKIEK